jgi:hypothetical protein
MIYTTFYKTENYLFAYAYSGPPMWSSSWLQVQRSWFDSRRYQIFWEVVGLERGPLSLMTSKIHGVLFLCMHIQWWEFYCLIIQIQYTHLNLEHCI